MRNNKGFTLVELLAVIVILAVVMLIAVTAVGPVMVRARKSALADEGGFLVDAAKTAYQAEQFNEDSPINASTSVCFDLKWLYSEGYYEKGAADDSYQGSALVSVNDGKYTYKYWITNGAYIFENATPGKVSANNATNGSSASNTCGGEGTVKCTGNTCS